MKQSLIVARSTDAAFELHPILIPKFARWSSTERLLPLEKLSPSIALCQSVDHSDFVLISRR
jgi:hypothetical protein